MEKHVFSLKNYMIPLKQVLSPQEMDAIFVNLEVSNCSSKDGEVYTARLGVSHTK